MFQSSISINSNSFSRIVSTSVAFFVWALAACDPEETEPEKVLTDKVSISNKANTAPHHNHVQTDFHIRHLNPNASYLQPVTVPKNTVEEAMAIIDQHFRYLTTEDVKNWIPKEELQNWFVCHQIRAFGVNHDRLGFLSSKLSDRPRLGSFNAWGIERHMEGHIGATASTLVRELELEQELVTPQAVINLNDMLRGLKQLYPREYVERNSDEPSWIIDTLLAQQSPFSPTSDGNPSTHIIAYLSLAIENARACDKLHFIETMDRVYRTASAGKGDAGDQLGIYSSNQILSKNVAILDNNLQLSINRMPKLMDEFTSEPDQDKAVKLQSAFLATGHTLEIVLHPESYFKGKFSEPTLTKSVDAFSRAIKKWFSNEYSQARDEANKFIMSGNKISPAFAINTHLLHGYRALSYWRDRQE